MKENRKKRVYDNIINMINDPLNPTPMVKLDNRFNPHEGFEIYLKLERVNPMGSIKDRTSKYMLENLKIEDGQTIVEPTSGNTGLGIAGVANAMNVPVKFIIPNGAPEEKKLLLRLTGAEVEEEDDGLCPISPDEGVRGAAKFYVEGPEGHKYVSPNQYENPLNVEVHIKYTGPEIWDQTDGEIKYFFAGFGTTGTITGVGTFLKKMNPNIKIIGVEPKDVSHKLAGMKRVSELKGSYVPTILDMKVIDDIIQINNQDAYDTAFKVARKIGTIVGPTTGAILAAALRYGKGKKGLGVAISPDDGFKYTSYFREFLQDT